MKKILLFSLGLGMACTAFSQGLTEQKMDKINHSEVRTDVVIQKQASPYEPTTLQLDYSKSVLLERVELGMSANVYSMLTSMQRCMSYDEVSGTIMGVFRADPATYSDALSSGSIMAHYSTDGGDSWEHVVTMNPDENVHALRYPSGVIYNPDGSSDVNDLFSVSAGPSHTGGVWDYTFFGTSQLNGVNHNDYYYEWSLADGNDWARSNMTTIPDGVMYHGADYETSGTQAINQTMKLYAGTGDAAAGLEWEVLETVTPDWYLDVDVALALYTTWAAWSRDGSIGYMWMIGVTNDSEEYGGYQPQVFYTEDGGDSWDEIELDMEDNAVLSEYLAPWEDANGNPGTVKPTMGVSTGGSRTFPGVVDYQGKLHLFAPMFGMSTQSAADAESGMWVRANAPGGDIFDIVLNPEGLQDIYFVDSVRTNKLEADAWNGVDWDHRLQASKSLDEKMVFAIWADNDNPDDEAYLNNPDLKGWSFNAELKMASDPVNLTDEDLYAGFFFYHYVSELTPLVDGVYQVPVSVSLTPAEYSVGDPAAQTTTSYVKGITFDKIVGVNEDLQLSASNFTVGQNSPNPFSTFTTVTVNSTTVADVMVEVSNLMGQSVYVIDAGIINGSMKVNIPATDLQAGVYFYTVTIGNESVTKKMIVE